MSKKLFFTGIIAGVILLCAQICVFAAEDVTFNISQYRGNTYNSYYNGNFNIYYLENPIDKKNASLSVINAQNLIVTFNGGQEDFDDIFRDYGYVVTPNSLRNGTITVIDKNKDGVYDTIDVWSPETFVVGGVDLEAKQLIAKNSGRIHVIDFDEQRDTITKDGVKIGLSDLNEWDVLEVFCDFFKDIDEREFTIKVLTNIIEGKITEVGLSETSWDIDGYGYGYYYCINYGNTKYDLAEGAYLTDRMGIGMQGTFVIDSYGKIASFIWTDTSRYGFVADIYESGGSFSDRYMAQMLTEDGDIKFYKFAKTIDWVNNDYVSGNSNELRNLKWKLIKFELNSSDEIWKVYTAERYGYGDGKFEQYTPDEGEYEYVKKDERFKTLSGGKPFYVDDTTKIFYPYKMQGSYFLEWDVSSVGGIETLVDNDTYVNLLAFDLDYYGNAKAVVIFDKQVENKNKFWIYDEMDNIGVEHRDVDVELSRYYSDKKLMLAGYKNNKMVAYNDVLEYGRFFLPLVTQNYENLDYVKILMWEDKDSLIPVETKTIYNVEYGREYEPINSEYGYITNIDDAAGFYNRKLLQILRQDGSVTNFKLAETVNNNTYGAVKTTFQGSGRDIGNGYFHEIDEFLLGPIETGMRYVDINNVLHDGSGIGKETVSGRRGKLVKFSTNKFNEVCAIEFANTYNENLPDGAFVQNQEESEYPPYSVGSYTYDSDSKELIATGTVDTVGVSAYEGKTVSVDENTLVYFIYVTNIPYSTRVDVEKSEVKTISSIADGVNYSTVQVFDEDNGIAKVVVIYADQKMIPYQNSLAVINSVSMAENMNGEKVRKISFYQDGEKKDALTTAGMVVLSDSLRKGAGAQFTFNSKGEIDGILNIYNATNVGIQKVIPTITSGLSALSGWNANEVRSYIADSNASKKLKIHTGPVRWFENNRLMVAPWFVEDATTQAGINAWMGASLDFIIRGNVNFYIYDESRNDVSKLLVGDAGDIDREYPDWNLVEHGAYYGSNGHIPAPALAARDYVIVREYDDVVTDVVVIKAYPYDFR